MPFRAVPLTASVMEAVHEITAKKNRDDGSNR